MKLNHEALAALVLAAALPPATPPLRWAMRQSAEAPAKSQATKPEALKANPDPLAPLLAQAQDALDRNNYAAAITLIQKILAERPGDALLHFELGYAYSGLKRLDEAAAEYRRAIALNPVLAAAHLNLGLALLDSDPSSAAESFRQAASLLPDQARLRYLTGQALERAGKLTDAITEYSAAAALSPKDGQMLFALARSLLRAGRVADAESQFRQAIALPGNAAPAKLGLAEALLHEDKNAQAADAFAAYLTDVPDDREARFERAVALQNLDRFDDALAELDRVEQGTAPAANTLKFRGSIYMQEKKWTEAGAALQKAVAAAPDDAELHAWLGRARLELRDYATAESELRRSLALDPAPAGPLRDLLEVLYLSGQCPAALATLDLLAQRETPVVLNWFIRGVCYDRLGQKSEAVAAYQKFLDVDQRRTPDQDFQVQQRLKLLLRELKR
jgi:Flp pilus assembly protein TadD